VRVHVLIMHINVDNTAANVCANTVTTVNDICINIVVKL